jgi:hypothetical protein
MEHVLGFDVRGWRFGYAYISAANHDFAEPLSDDGFGAAWSTNAIHSHRDWDDQFACKLDGIARNN